MYETIEKYRDRIYPVLNFENLVEIVDYIRNYPDLKKYDFVHRINSGESAEFLGTNNLDKTLERLKYGNDEVTTIYLANIKDLKSENGDDSQGYYMDIQGVAYDMGAVVAGEPECCINQGAPNPRPYLKILIDTGYNGRVKQGTIDNRGIAIYHLINSLIAKNYILDVEFIHYIDMMGMPYAQRFKISLENLVLSQIAFFGTCEFFRAVTWLLTALQSKRKRYDGRMGKSMPSDGAIRQFKKEGLFIPSGYTDERFNDCTLEQAKKYVTEIYNNFVEGKNENN